MVNGDIENIILRSKIVSGMKINSINRESGHLTILVLLLITYSLSLDSIAQSYDPDNPFLGPLSEGKRKPKLIITTDHGTCDYDDIQSLGHLFIYADVLDIRGLIESHPRCSRDTRISDIEL
jgi:hypothetical protein